jgi:hypothetical protein
MDPHDLYGLPLDRFTDERNALAKQRRRDGDRERAAEVAKLKKPSLAAWAVNQLVRTQRREVDALFEAGDALQKAQADVLSARGDPGSLRRAAEAERAALDRLTAKAHGLLSSEGHELTPAKLEQVSDTLHAAAIDQDAREAVRDGCLVRELRHVGLGALGAPAATPRRRSSSRERAPKDGRASERRAERQAEAAARRERERAGRALEAAETRRDRVAEQLREAEEAVQRARRALDQLKP